jgi:arsenate reductase
MVIARDRMAQVEIWHNPGCSKSRRVLQRVRDAGLAPVVVEYLASPPSRERLREVLGLLGTPDPRVLMRTSEPIYRELALAQVHDAEALLGAMVRHPILIERPVIIRDNLRAVIGRPPERVDALLLE